MSVHLASSHSATRQTDPTVDRILGDLLVGEFEPATRDLLISAAGGDPLLLRALVLTGVGFGDLLRHEGRWRWNGATSRAGRLAALVEHRRAGFGAAQLAALRTLTDSWARPYLLVADDAGAEDEASAADERAAALGLTHREQQILALLADGLTAGAIGRRLRLSPRTIAKHQQRMYRKFGTTDRLTTVLRAQRLGLLPGIPTDADQFGA